MGLQSPQKGYEGAVGCHYGRAATRPSQVVNDRSQLYLSTHGFQSWSNDRSQETGAEVNPLSHVN